MTRHHPLAGVRMADNGWDVVAPFCIEVDIVEAHIDWLQHVNNAVYLQLLEQAAWRHSESFGLGRQVFEAHDMACVVRRHELDYLQPALLGDRLQVATWIMENDGRLVLWRGSQIRRMRDGRTLFRGRTQFVCVRMSDGRPRRMPQPLVEAYRPVDETQG